MLTEESEVFAKDDTDIGNVEHKKMKIRLKDDIPCQATYNSLPHPLYQQWITNSHSGYSSPVVAARNEHGTLRICCEYRKFNAFLITTFFLVYKT